MYFAVPRDVRNYDDDNYYRNIFCLIQICLSGAIFFSSFFSLFTANDSDDKINLIRRLFLDTFILHLDAGDADTSIAMKAVTQLRFVIETYTIIGSHKK